MTPKTDYEATAAAFNAVAPDYDGTYGLHGNAVMSWMRVENLALLRELFPANSHLLELGCGTGDEAIALAQAGHTIMATDISPGMVAITREKALAAGLEERVSAAAVPAAEIGALYPRGHFDGAYASFGALNCEPDLAAVGAALASLVRPGGAFVVSVMGRTCLFEIAWYLAHGQPRRAFRRLSIEWQPAPVAGLNGLEVRVPTRYLGLQDVRRAFAAFSLERALALPLLLPPPYADALFCRRRALFARLETWERRLRTRRPWRTLGDHIVLVLRRPQ